MSPYIERVTLRKVLMMQDLNIQSQFVGKSLDEVNFSDIIYDTFVGDSSAEVSDTDNHEVLEMDNHEMAEMSNDEIELSTSASNNTNDIGMKKTLRKKAKNQQGKSGLLKKLKN